MDAVLAILGKVQSLEAKNDDVIDRLNRRYTFVLLVTFAAVISTKQLVGEPITCWCPAHFTSNHQEFTNKICWISNTYYIPEEDNRVPDVTEKRAVIGYYQWVPLILLSQALFFYLPRLLWKLITSSIALDLAGVTATLSTTRYVSGLDARDDSLRQSAKHVDSYLSPVSPVIKARSMCQCLTRCYKLMSKYGWCAYGKKSGNYLTAVYVTVKLLYMINITGQLVALNYFLGSSFHLFGYDAVSKLIATGETSFSDRFPLKTLCDFNIRDVGTGRRSTVECVMPLNLFNEKIYLFIWFWYVFVLLLTLLSLARWLCRLAPPSFHIRLIRQHLRAAGCDTLGSKVFVKRFVYDYLQRDGILVVHMITDNTNKLVASGFVRALWELYRSDNSARHNNGPNEV